MTGWKYLNMYIHSNTVNIHIISRTSGGVCGGVCQFLKLIYTLSIYDPSHFCDIFERRKPVGRQQGWEPLEH